MADNDDIPFNRDFPLKPGVVDEARPGVRRVLCNNPSPFTFTGTVSYIVGKGNVGNTYIYGPNFGNDVIYEDLDGTGTDVLDISLLKGVGQTLGCAAPAAPLQALAVPAVAAAKN